MRALEFIPGHMFYNPDYNQILQTTETRDGAIVEARTSFLCETRVIELVSTESDLSRPASKAFKFFFLNIKKKHMYHFK